ncbi:MAG: Rrf2 family transcriptional regulator, partial [Minwuiales bacterium]|nr:Rrf2 family transcriptional regulator [Minwuiales bacterium]
MTDYAVVMMADMARLPGEVRTAPQLAEATGVPLPTVSKLLKNLANGGLMQSQRGASGGYSLSRAPEEITVAEIIAAVEGPIALTACVDGSPDQC